MSPPALRGALARFAPFFYNPLFTASATARELKAVDSEHKKNLQSDIHRMYYVNKHLSKPGYPWKKFSTGSIESLSRAAQELHSKGLLKGNITRQTDTASDLNTLEHSRLDITASSAPYSVELEGDGGLVGREIRRRLIEWWKAEYSANRMHLCVIGKG